MPQRFGQQSDPSQNFAYLARSNAATIRERAQAVDRAREEELAAKDQEMFTRYQEGKISGAAIIAYIKKRIRSTGYDPAQQRKWKAALVEYQNSVSDERAAAQFEKTQNTAAYLNHWQQRLRTTKKGTPERTQIEAQIRALKDRMDAESIRARAIKITNLINSGKMNTKDLIDFYKSEINGLRPGSPLTLSLKERLSELKKQWREEKFTIKVQQIKTELGTGKISPQQAAESIRNLMGTMNLDDSNPVLYTQMLEQTRIMNATPDPNVTTMLTLKMQLGTITPEEYLDEMTKLADQVRPYSASSATAILMGAHDDVKKYAPQERGLPNKAVLGQGEGGGSASGGEGIGAAASAMRDYVNRVVTHVYQMDGSRFSAQNCTMAAAAMLGRTMGDKGATGADYRYASRDRSGGVTLQGAQYALEQRGITGSRLRFENRIEFNQFKNNIKNGAPAVLSGFNGSLTDQSLNSSGIMAGHAIYVTMFHPKKGFFVLDPAKRGDKGQWWPASEIRNFAWGGDRGSGFYRYGQALFAPRNTLKTRWNDGATAKQSKSPTGQNASIGANRSGGGAFATGGESAAGGGQEHVWVGSPASNDSVPEQYVGQFSEGPIAPEILAVANESINKNTDPLAVRLADAGISGEIDTIDEAVAELETRQRGTTEATFLLENFAEAYAEDPNAESWTVTVGDVTTELTMDDANQLEKELIFQLDGMELLYTSLDAMDNAVGVRRDKARIVTIANGVTDSSFQYGFDVIVNGIWANINTNTSSDPTDVMADIALGEQTLEAFMQKSGLEDVPTGGQQGTAEGGAPAEEEQPDPITEAQQLAEQLSEIGRTQEGNEALVEATGMLKILRLLQDNTQPTELRNQAIADIAGGMGVKLPDGWEFGRNGDEFFEPGDNSLAGLISLNTHAANQVKMVETGEGYWHMVPVGEWGSAIVAVPWRYSAGVDENGQRIVEDSGAQPLLDDSGQPILDEAGNQAFGKATISSDKESDTEYLENHYGVELKPAERNSSLAFPLTTQMVDGEAIVMRAVPRRINYPGMTMLRVGGSNDAQLQWQEGTGRDVPANGGLLGPADLEGLLKLRLGKQQQAAWLESGVLEEVPYPVDVLSMPATTDADGNTIPGLTYVIDPLTGLQHADGLPMDGLIGGDKNEQGIAVGEDFGLQYVPGRINELGQPEPDMTFQVGNDADPAGVGVQSSYSGDIAPEDMQDKLENGELGEMSFLVRGPDGQVTTFGPNDPYFTEMYTTTNRTAVEHASREGNNERIWGFITEAREAAEERALDIDLQERLSQGGFGISAIGLGMNLEDFGVTSGQQQAQQAAFVPPQPGDIDLPDVSKLGGADPIQGLPKIETPPPTFDPTSTGAADTDFGAVETPSPEPTTRGKDTRTDYKPPTPEPVDQVKGPRKI
jgi:hypothetical protein